MEDGNYTVLNEEYYEKKKQDEIKLCKTGIYVADIQKVFCRNTSKILNVSMNKDGKTVIVTFRKYVIDGQLQIYVMNDKGHSGSSVHSFQNFLFMTQSEFDAIIMNLLYYAD